MADFSFIRGDSFPIKFKITDSDGSPILKNGLSSLFLTCRKSNTKSSPILFQKKIEDFYYDEDDTFYYISFEPEDTRELKYGEYNFDIEATFTDGYVKTLKSSFEITAEDTIYEGGKNE